MQHLVLKTLIVGAERSSLAENDLVALGLSPSSDPAQTALEALAATHLAGKAGFQLAAAVRSGSDSRQVADVRKVCSDEAVVDLKLILSGPYAGALAEFLDLLPQKNLRLPPEFLPELLEKITRDVALAEKIRPALGARGEWLARQNPRWKWLLAEDTRKKSPTSRRKKEPPRNSPLLEFEEFTQPWPKALLEKLLEQYRPSAYGTGGFPGWHFVLALRTAAYHCQPADATNSAFVRDYFQNPPKARPREFEEFLAILRFRQEMRKHLEISAKSKSTAKIAKNAKD